MERWLLTTAEFQSDSNHPLATAIGCFQIAVANGCFRLEVAEMDHLSVVDMVLGGNFGWSDDPNETLGRGFSGFVTCWRTCTSGRWMLPFLYSRPTDGSNIGRLPQQ